MEGNADMDLAHYPDKGFDYAVLTQVLQVTQHPEKILDEVLRIADKAIVSIPNFGYWQNRTQLLLNGRMPVTKKLSYQWYETPNIHFCTIRDFIILCTDLGIKIEKRLAIKPNGKVISFDKNSMIANLQGELGIFLLGK
jgi:methionine biosynthesis protein MetW